MNTYNTDPQIWAIYAKNRPKARLEIYYGRVVAAPYGAKHTSGGVLAKFESTQAALEALVKTGCWEVCTHCGEVAELRVCGEALQTQTATARVEGATAAVFEFPGGGCIEVYPGRLESHNLKVDVDEDHFSAVYNAAIDGIESLLLAMASAGIPMDTPQMKEAVSTAVATVSDKFC